MTAAVLALTVVVVVEVPLTSAVVFVSADCLVEVALEKELLLFQKKLFEWISQ